LKLGVVDFSEINASASEALYVVRPFTPHEQIEAALGLAWDEGKTAAIGRRGDINLLVFIKDGAVVTSLELRRGKLDFALSSSVERFTPQTAQFQSEVMPSGPIILTPLTP
jgi:hypothetical protein